MEIYLFEVVLITIAWAAEQYFFFGGGGGSSGETKIAEGIRDARNRRFVLYIAFAGKSVCVCVWGGGGGAIAPPAPPPMDC